MLYRCTLPALVLALILSAGCTARNQTPPDTLADLAGKDVSSPEVEARIDTVTGVDQDPVLVRRHAERTIVAGHSASGLVVTAVAEDGDVAWQETLDLQGDRVAVDWMGEHAGGFSNPLLEIPLSGGPARTLLMAVTDDGLWPVRLVDARGRAVNWELSERLPNLQYPRVSLSAPELVAKQAALVRLAQPAARSERQTAKVTSQLEDLAGSTNRWQAEDAAGILHQD